VKWFKWKCGGCGRANYSRTTALPSSASVTALCSFCGRSETAHWQETGSPDRTVTAEEMFWQCPSCGKDNESPADRKGATLEACGVCGAECGVLWLGTWEGPLGSFDV
jgi:transcription elongation factor Elf1